jgi:20S proteasome alpha/beta subunit
MVGPDAGAWLQSVDRPDVERRGCVPAAPSSICTRAPSTLQAAYKRSFAGIMILGAVDDEKGPQVFKVDPAGHVLGYKVRAGGGRSRVEAWTRGGRPVACRGMDARAPLPIFSSTFCLSTVNHPIHTLPRLQATAAGSKEQEAANALEKFFKPATSTAGEGEAEGPGAAAAAPVVRRTLDADETVRLAISTMQGVLSSDFKAAEIEIAVVSERRKGSGDAMHGEGSHSCRSDRRARVHLDLRFPACAARRVASDPSPLSSPHRRSGPASASACCPRQRWRRI